MLQCERRGPQVVGGYGGSRVAQLPEEFPVAPGRRVRGVAHPRSAGRFAPVGAGLRFLRARMAEVGSAHQAHAALAPDLSDAEPPAALRYVYGDEATAFRAAGHQHMRAALAVIRDSEAPACFALLRALEGGAGPRRRATAWYYGTASALVALFDAQELAPAVLAVHAEQACGAGDGALRARAAAVLGDLGVGEPRRIDAMDPSRP